MRGDSSAAVISERRTKSSHLHTCADVACVFPKRRGKKRLAAVRVTPLPCKSHARRSQNGPFGFCASGPPGLSDKFGFRAAAEAQAFPLRTVSSLLPLTSWNSNSNFFRPATSLGPKKDVIFKRPLIASLVFVLVALASSSRRDHACTLKSKDRFFLQVLLCQSCNKSMADTCRHQHQAMTKSVHPLQPLLLWGNSAPVLLLFFFYVCSRPNQELNPHGSI